MTDEPSKLQSTDNAMVGRLMKEATITEEQARELIALIGYEWPSLLREARLLAKKR
ncbi:hypothetical protein WHT83_08110 [Aminobacter sp. P9b]|uniref:hypothetical protein n=1 Tax=Aminobacter sp. P9b TaxID=3133697 RepID=UPI003246A952